MQNSVAELNSTGKSINPTAASHTGNDAVAKPMQTATQPVPLASPQPVGKNLQHKNRNFIFFLPGFAPDSAFYAPYSFVRNTR